jgi:glycosyltransferase involved in cell wall biosynthesis
MAIVLSRPKEEAKGVIVFSHKEKILVQKNFDAINRLKNNYLITCHVGHYQKDSVWCEHYDFVFGAIGVFKNPPNNFIELSSRDFVCGLVNKKEYDLIFVGNPTHHKRLDILFELLKDLDKIQGSRIRLLLVIPKLSWIYATHEHYVSKIVDNRWDNIKLNVLRIETNSSLYPLSNNTIKRLMQSSLALIHTSTQEGEARVIQEAFLCGLHSFVNHDLIGGGGSNLPVGSVTFYKSACDVMATLSQLRNVREKVDGRKYDYSQKLQRLTFLEALGPLKDKISTYKFIEQDLAFALPSQIVDVPYIPDSYKTCDLSDQIDFDNFLCFIENESMEKVEIRARLLRWKLIDLLYLFSRKIYYLFN